MVSDNPETFADLDGHGDGTAVAEPEAAEGAEAAEGMTAAEAAEGGAETGAEIVRE